MENGQQQKMKNTSNLFSIVTRAKCVL